MTETQTSKAKREHGPTTITREQILAGDVHVISDTHFGHAKITQQAPRPGYAADGEHDGQLHESLTFEAWRRRVKPGQRVLHLGDVSWNRRGVLAAVEAELPGDVEVVEGNHDNSGQRKDVVKKLGWRFIDPISLEWTVQVHDKETGDVTAEHTRLVFITHYAIPADELPENATNAHGHQHGSQSPYTDHRHRDLSLENTGYGPLPLKGVLDSLVLQAAGEGAGQIDPQLADTLRLALANRIT